MACFVLHVTLPELILAGLVSGCALCALLAEWKPGGKNGSDEEPPEQAVA